MNWKAFLHLKYWKYWRNAGAAPDGAADSSVGHGPEARGRGLLSPLTRRMLALNVLALAILAGGLLYFDRYRAELIESELAGLRTQGEIFAAALGAGAVVSGPGFEKHLSPELSAQMLRRLVEPIRTRARLFDRTGKLIADSRALLGPGGEVETQNLEVSRGSGVLTALTDGFGWILSHLRWPGKKLPPYREFNVEHATDYEEAMRAMRGEWQGTVRTLGNGGMILSGAVPVQQFKNVLGALLLSKGSAGIERSLHDVRLDILKMFAVVLAVTVLLSLYLAGTIVRPIRRLAAAAEQVRHGRGRRFGIPDFGERDDEIGDLAGALRDMTSELWRRMDAIERFAADVAHEIRNPLTSLKSAVETTSRVKDPEQLQRLLEIIKDDVERLDRLITVISEASRIDAEISREESEIIDIGKMLQTLVDAYRKTLPEQAPDFRLCLDDKTRFKVLGIESRLAQIFRNLIDNAVSFTRPGTTVLIKVARTDGFIEVRVMDEGPGLPEGRTDAIFERFYSERPAGESPEKHSGLGLSIVRQIIDAHEGKIQAENRRDGQGRIKGACFTVRLPAQN
jgi:two-component system sensor histidine kinase ChvG